MSTPCDKSTPWIRTDKISLRILTYLLTPCCRVLLEKLTGLQLAKKFAAFHRTRRFFTALTTVRHLSLSWASPIQSIYPHPTSCRSILILSTHLHLCFPSGLLPSVFPTKTLSPPSPQPYTPYLQRFNESSFHFCTRSLIITTSPWVNVRCFLMSCNVKS